MEMNKQTQFNIWYWVAAFFGLMLFQYVFATTHPAPQHLHRLTIWKTTWPFQEGLAAEIIFAPQQFG